MDTGFNDGYSNMNLDIQLAQNCMPSEAFLRLYRWNPFCISLGAGQNINSVNTVKASEEGINFVKRPTGGRAILHSEELTYSVVYPLTENLSLKNLYYRINSALLKGLRIYDNRLEDLILFTKKISARFVSVSRQRVKLST
jgi:lipoate-protein ligase A